MAYDKLGIWHDSATGRFAPKGWSSARSLAWKLVRGVNTRDRIHGDRDRSGKARLFDSALAEYGLSKGDVVGVEFVDDRRGRVRVRTKGGGERLILVPWDSFDDTYRPARPKKPVLKKQVVGKPQAKNPVLASEVEWFPDQPAIKAADGSRVGYIEQFDKMSPDEAALVRRAVEERIADGDYYGIKDAAFTLADGVALTQSWRGASVASLPSSSTVADVKVGDWSGSVRIARIARGRGPLISSSDDDYLFYDADDQLVAFAHPGESAASYGRPISGLTKDDFVARTKAKLEVTSSAEFLGPHSAWRQDVNAGRTFGFVMGDDHVVRADGMGFEATDAYNAKAAAAPVDKRFEVAAALLPYVNDLDSFDISGDGTVSVSGKTVGLDVLQSFAGETAPYTALLDHLFPPERFDMPLGVSIPLKNPDRPDSGLKRMHLGRVLDYGSTEAAFALVDDDGNETGLRASVFGPFDGELEDGALATPDLQARWAAGPGRFSQPFLSNLASRHRKDDGTFDHYVDIGAYPSDYTSTGPGAVESLERPQGPLGPSLSSTRSHSPLVVQADEEGTADIISVRARQENYRLWRDRATGDIYVNKDWVNNKRPLFKGTTEGEARQIAYAWQFGVPPRDYKKLVAEGGVMDDDGVLHVGDESFTDLKGYQNWLLKAVVRERRDHAIGGLDATVDTFTDPAAFGEAAKKALRSGADTPDSKVYRPKIESSEWESTGVDLEVQREWLDGFPVDEIFDAAIASARTDLPVGAAESVDALRERITRTFASISRERNYKLPPPLHDAPDRIARLLSAAQLRDVLSTSTTPSDVTNRVEAVAELTDAGLPGDIDFRDLPAAWMGNVRTEMGDDAYKAAIINGLLDTQNGSWADSSQSHFSTATQRATVELLGLDVDADFGGWKKWVDGRASSRGFATEYELGEMAMARLSVLSTYTLTQNDLDGRGVGPDDVVIVHRGSEEPAFGAAARLETPTVWVGTNPLAATASKPASAFSGVQIAMRVPRSRVLSTALTGPGTYKENEVVVIGDPDGYLGAVKESSDAAEALKLVKSHLDSAALQSIPFANAIAELPTDVQEVNFGFLKGMKKPYVAPSLSDLLPFKDNAVIFKAAVDHGDIGPLIEATDPSGTSTPYEVGQRLADRAVRAASGFGGLDRYRFYQTALDGIDEWGFDRFGRSRYDQTTGKYVVEPYNVAEIGEARAAFKMRLMDRGLNIGTDTPPLTTVPSGGMVLVYDGPSGDTIDVSNYGEFTSIPGRFRVVPVDGDTEPHPAGPGTAIPKAVPTESGPVIVSRPTVAEVKATALKPGDLVYQGPAGTMAPTFQGTVQSVEVTGTERRVTFEAPDGSSFDRNYLRGDDDQLTVTVVTPPTEGVAVTESGWVIRPDGSTVDAPSVGPAYAMAEGASVVGHVRRELEAGRVSFDDIDRWRASVTNDEGDVYTPEQWIGGYVEARGRERWPGTFDEYKASTMGVVAALTPDARPVVQLDPSKSPNFAPLRSLDLPETTTRQVTFADLKVGDRVRFGNGIEETVKAVSVDSDGSVTLTTFDRLRTVYAGQAPITTVSTVGDVPYVSLQVGDRYRDASGRRFEVTSAPTPDGLNNAFLTFKVLDLDARIGGDADEYAGSHVTLIPPPTPGSQRLASDLIVGDVVDGSTFGYLDGVLDGSSLRSGPVKVTRVYDRNVAVPGGASAEFPNGVYTRMLLESADGSRQYEVKVPHDGTKVTLTDPFPGETTAADAKAGDRLVIDGETVKVAKVERTGTSVNIYYGTPGHFTNYPPGYPMRKLPDAPPPAKSPLGPLATNLASTLEPGDGFVPPGVDVGPVKVTNATDHGDGTVKVAFKAPDGSTGAWTGAGSTMVSTPLPPDVPPDGSFAVKLLSAGDHVDIPGGPENATVVSTGTSSSGDVILNYKADDGSTGSWMDSGDSALPATLAF